MNVQLKEGNTFTNEANQYTYNEGFGRIRNMNFVIISGEMADPENFKAQAVAIICFYTGKPAAVSGAQPLYTVEINLQDTEVIAILDIDEATGYSVSEKKIYDYFLNNNEDFEII
jgi:hypothetical protein